MSKDSNGLYHPCGWQDADALGAAVNVMTVPDASNFYVGDLIEIRSLAGVKDSVTIAAGDDPSDLLIVATTFGNSLRKIKLTDAGGVSDPFAFTITDDSGEFLVDIQLTTDAGTDVDATVATLSAYIDANQVAMGFVSSTQETPADLCAAVAATALTGGVAVGAAIVSARGVTATTATTVTWDGATSTFAAGDYLLKTGAHRPYGVSDRVVSTIRYVDNTLVTESKAIDVRYAGDLRSGQVTGLSDPLKLAMQGGPYVDPQAILAGTLINPAPTMGFVFIAV